MLLAALAGISLTGLSACGHLDMMGHDNNEVQRPAASEFGVGPRTSLAHHYRATLKPEQKLRLRHLQTVRVVLTDLEGHPVDGAAITVDGGMPRHGHGLPTQPRVTAAFGAGVYEIQGVRFTMGGWWELKLAIDAADGTDTVTFNLDLS